MFQSNDGTDNSVAVDDNGDDGLDEPLNVTAKKFLYKVRGENRLTGTAIQNIALSTRYLVHGMLSRVKRKVGDILHNVGTEDGDIQNVNSIFAEAAEDIEILAFPMSDTLSLDDHTSIDNIVSIE